MIITEQITIDGRQFTKTVSDAGFYIERDGVQYSEAIDPIEFDRRYTETDDPIEDDPEQSEIEQKAEAWDELTGGASDE